MTYNVFIGTLNPTQSITDPCYWAFKNDTSTCSPTGNGKMYPAGWF